MRKQPITPYILSVIASDLLFCSFILPIIAIRYLTRQSEAIFWSPLCDIVPAVFYIALGGFIVNLTILTLSRTLQVVYKEKAEGYLNPKIRTALVCFCWLAPILALVPQLSKTYGKFGLKTYTQSCTMVPDEFDQCPKTVIYTIFVFVPVGIMFICNVVICIKTKILSLKGKEIGFLMSIFLVFLYFLVTIIPSFIIEHCQSMERPAKKN